MVIEVKTTSSALNGGGNKTKNKNRQGSKSGRVAGFNGMFLAN
jgi:hypothetical protein